MSNQIKPSPFHKGEQELQTLYGVREKLEAMGQSFIRDYLPEQHRQFYQQLPYVFVGSIDAAGRPWASLVLGRPGFIQSPDEYKLRLNTSRIDGDPLNNNISTGSAIGILGLQFETRRRNRLSAKVESSDDRIINLAVVQAFGNCPQYIQARGIEAHDIEPCELDSFPNIDSVGEERPKSSFNELSARAKEIIQTADNFYIATHHTGENGAASSGADVSHRGGKPGFVRVDNDQSITFPDFSGNFHFNTLGNILLNPLAGLLFIDFDTGDLLYLTCRAEIIHDSEEKRAFEGAERLVRFDLDEGILLDKAVPLEWKFIGYSPSLDRTGSWEEVAETLAARRSTNVYRNYKVVRIEQESEVIRSFYLEPERLEPERLESEGNEPIHCHRAGQFLPIEIKLPGHDTSIKRTYTISNAPNGQYYRLSIKREPAASEDYPPGLSSNYFHDHIEEGAQICGLAPRGQFVLEEHSMRPVVLLSAGVGITPMIAMLEELANEKSTCGSHRKVWFIHGAMNSQVHAFSDHVNKLTSDWPDATAHYAYSAPLKSDIQGTHYNSKGRVSIDLLKSILPLDGHDYNYDFYFCGPPGFMDAIYDALKKLNVPDDQIHYEFFGPGASLLQNAPGENRGLIGNFENQDPVSVHFEKSDKEVDWESSLGTLLDLAEKEGLTPDYSCRSGVCGTCSTRVIEGDVDYVDPPLADVEDGHALICCSYPGKKSTQSRMLRLDL